MSSNRDTYRKTRLCDGSRTRAAVLAIAPFEWITITVVRTKRWTEDHLTGAQLIVGLAALVVAMVLFLGVAGVVQRRAIAAADPPYTGDGERDRWR